MSQDMELYKTLAISERDSVRKRVNLQGSGSPKLIASTAPIQ